MAGYWKKENNWMMSGKDLIKRKRDLTKKKEELEEEIALLDHFIKKRVRSSPELALEIAQKKAKGLSKKEKNVIAMELIIEYMGNLGGQDFADEEGINKDVLKIAKAIMGPDFNAKGFKITFGSG